MSHAKPYPFVRDLYGDDGENETALAVATVLVPGPHYPDCGRIIAGSPPSEPGNYYAPIGGFSCGPEAATNLIGVLEDAIEDVDKVLDAESPPVTVAVGDERVRRLRRGRFRSIPARCENCCEPIKAGENIQAFHVWAAMKLDEQGQPLSSIGDKAYVHADPCGVEDEESAPVRPHLIEGEFQSDKYSWCQRGFVPLKITDPMAQDLLMEYAQRRRAVDAEFAADLEEALRLKGYMPPFGDATVGRLTISNMDAAGQLTRDDTYLTLATPPRDDFAAYNAGRAVSPWIQTPIPALWFDRKGHGPDHMLLRLHPFDAEAIDDREIPASLGLRIKRDLVLVGEPLVDGGFQMARAQVADLHGQLGAWLAGAPMAPKRFFRALIRGTGGEAVVYAVGADLAHAQRIIGESLDESPTSPDYQWSELSEAEAEKVPSHRGAPRALAECDLGEWLVE